MYIFTLRVTGEFQLAREVQSMTDSLELVTVLERILNDNVPEGDINQLRQSLTASNGKDVVQLGKYNVNIGNGKDIHVGDKVCRGADAQNIQIFIERLLQTNSK